MECEPELPLNFVHGNLTCSLPRKQGQTDPAWPRGPNGTPACCRKPRGILLSGSDPERLLQRVIPCVCPLLSRLFLSTLQPLLISPELISPFQAAVSLNQRKISSQEGRARMLSSAQKETSVCVYGLAPAGCVCPRHQELRSTSLCERYLRSNSGVMIIWVF